MWNYIKRYLHFGIIASLFMVGEVLMDLIQPKIMSYIVDDGVLGINNNGIGDINLIMKYGLIMIGLVIFGGLSGSLNNVFVHLTGQNIGNEMRKDCFRKIMNFSFPQIDKFSTGSLVTRVTNDITQVQGLVSQFIRGMIRTTLLTFGSIFFIFNINFNFGVIVLCAFPLILGCMLFCLYKANPIFSKLQSQLDNINNILQEDISGIRIIKACVQEVYEKLKFGKSNDELIKTQLKVLIIFAFMNPTMNLIMYIVVVIILLVGSHQVGMGATTTGSIMAVITYTTQLLNGILMLIMLFQNISRGTASWKRIKEILNTTPDFKDGNFKENSKLLGTVEFKNVSFTYPNTDKIILNNINLKINQGETIAIMGATGCGKTSLVNLIPRFYDVTSGEVLVDGINVKEYNQKDLREKVSIALQKSELFSLSIKDNIYWGNLSANDSDILQATQIAQADDFINNTPHKFDTLIAERGMSLSGGQKQRVSISRAILKPSEILIFDDSTSALDLKTEANLYSALNKFKPNITKIIIAQRIASVKNADRIVILDNGNIVDCGSHNELIKSCKIYQDIYHSQIGNEVN